jgi:flagellar protein FliS
MSAYHSVGVESIVDSASPTQLVLMLHEGAIAALASAQQHMLQKNIAAKGEAISKAITIIESGLRGSLDLKVGGELAQNLSELYQYMGRRLLHANLKNDPAALDEVRRLLQQLRGAWETLAATTTAAAARPSPPAQPRRAATSYGSI